MGRARDHGVVIGRFRPGERNAIADVTGVRVSHTTVARDEAVGVEDGRHRDLAALAEGG